MENTREQATISLAAHEASEARAERREKRLISVIVILILLLVGSNIGWLYYESQFEEVTTEITQGNADGYNNYIGNDGDINNGKAEN